MTSAIPAAAYVVCVIACIWAAAAALSRWVHADALDRALVAGVTAITVPVAVALLLGMANVLYAWSFLVSLIVIGLGSVVAVVRKPHPAERTPAAWSLAGMASLVTGSAFALLALAPTIAGRPTEEYDSRNYHIVNLATWVRTHSIWQLPFQNPAYFTATHPGNGEMLGLAMLFATQGDQLVYVANLFLAAFAVAACAVIARELDGRPDLAALAAVALLGTPLIFGTQAHSLMTDLAATSGVAGGVAALLRARRTRDVRWIAVAGCALGFALGAKYSTLLLVPIVIAIAAVALRPRRNLLWLLPGIALLAGPWFLRNLIATGNPVFPQAVRLGGIEILGGGESPLLAYSTTVVGHIVAGRFAALGTTLRLAFELAGPALLLAGAGLVVAFVRAPRRIDRMAVTFIAGAGAFIYAITPYSGGGDDAVNFLIASSMRYAIPAALIATAVAVAVVPSRLVIVLATATFAFDVWHMARGYGWRGDLDLRTPLVALVVAALALGAVGAIVVLGQRRLNYRPFAWAPVTAMSCLVVAFGIGQMDASIGRTRLQNVLAQIGVEDIVVLGVEDVRSTLGPELQASLRRVTGGGLNGEHPPSVERLDKAVDEAGGDVLVVQDGTPAVPQGWVPGSGWQLAATTPQGDVYVRPEQDAPAPPEPAAPEAPTPTPPAAPDAPAPPAP